MKKKLTKTGIDKNYFRATSYELAGDIGAIDNDDMIHNREATISRSYGKGNRFKVKGK